MIKPINYAIASFKGVFKDETLYYSETQENVVTRTTKVLKNPNQAGESMCDKFECRNNHFLFEPDNKPDKVNLFLLKGPQLKTDRNGKTIITKSFEKIHIGTYDMERLFVPEDIDELLLKPSNNEEGCGFLGIISAAVLLGMSVFAIALSTINNKIGDSVKHLIKNITKVIKH